MKLSRSRGLTSLTAALFVIAVAATPASGAGTIWGFAPTPGAGQNFSRLNAVAATSSSDVWAVGLSRKTLSAPYRTLTLHFDGNAWRTVRSPSVGTSTNELNGVDAGSASEAWAVGHSFSGSAERTLAEHYDGTAWTVVASPNDGAGNNTLRGVSIVSPTDVWAVGSSQSAEKPLALHFDGAAWTVVPMPTPSAGGFLNAVVALASNDVWAVGGTGDDGDDALVEHWNGSQWEIVPTPTLLGDESLQSVTAISSSDIWAVGHAGSSNLAEHWDGTAWSVATTPDPLPTSRGTNFLTGVVALSANDVWAVGGTRDFTLGSLIQTVSLHFDGAVWSIVPSPNRGTGDNTLLGVATPSPGSLVTAGSFRPTLPAYDRTMVMTTDQA